MNNDMEQLADTFFVTVRDFCVAAITRQTAPIERTQRELLEQNARLLRDITALRKRLETLEASERAQPALRAVR